MEIPAKQQKLMDTALDLFKKFGIRRVTVEEICRTAEVSKVTFYKYFRNKIHLTKEILNAMIAEAIEFRDSLMALDSPFPVKVRQIIEFKLAQNENVSADFMQDIYAEVPEIREFMEEKTAENMDGIMQFFQTAQDNGELRKDLNLNFLAVMTAKLTDLVNDPALQAVIPDQMQLNMEVIKFYFYGLFTIPDSGND